MRFGACTLELVSVRRSGRATDTGAGGLRATSIDAVAAAALDDPAAAVAEQTAGTVTIVFTDIEGSTARAVELGDVRWMETLGAHNALVRSRLARHGGREVKAQGDGFMLSFPSARRALGCMIDVQRKLAAYGRSRRSSRCGCGWACTRARSSSATTATCSGATSSPPRVSPTWRSGGEILASSLVREIVESRGDVLFGPPRSVTLKGMGGTQMAHPVSWRGPCNQA